MVNVHRLTPEARRNDRRAAHAEESVAHGNPLISLPAPENKPPRSVPERDLLIRVARLRDLLHVRSVDLTYRLNQPESMLTNRNPLSRLASVAASRGKSKPTTLLAESGRELLGYCEFHPLMPDLRWQLSTLGLVRMSDDPQSIWLPLLEDGTRYAGRAGAKRLYARAPVESLVGDVLRMAGYVAYARERVLVTRAYTPQPDRLTFRAQERTDTWAIHQLYNHSVPREVLNIEAYTSHRWELGEGRSEETGEVRAWIHEDREGPVIYIRSESARRRHVLDVIYAIGRAGDAVRMIDSLVGSGSLDLRGGEAYLAVRSYNSELEHLLLERNLGLWLEQDLFIRYTTAPVRVQATDAVSFESEALERTPKHVPAYYIGQEPRTVRGAPFRLLPEQPNRTRPTFVIPE